jgi:DNA replication protein DnaC
MIQVNGFQVSNDERGYKFATPSAVNREYTSTIECTDIPVPNLPALEEEPLPWIGGLLYGPTGAGKSYRAIREMQTALRAGASAKFISIPRFIEESREVERTSQEERRALLRAAARCRYAVLDDLGAEKVTDFAGEALYLLIDGRLSKALPTVVTSNLSPDEIARVHGDRIISRILGFGPARPLDGRDQRLH